MGMCPKGRQASLYLYPTKSRAWGARGVTAASRTVANSIAHASQSPSPLLLPKTEEMERIAAPIACHGLRPCKYALCTARPWHTARLITRCGRHAATSAVLFDENLLGAILEGNIGPSGFAAVALVCRAWRDLCRTNERLLRAVALYTGGLTRTLFTCLLVVSKTLADALPRETGLRRGGGEYHLYGAPAVDTVLREHGGIRGWCERLRERGRSDARRAQVRKNELARRATDSEALAPRKPASRNCYRAASCKEEGHRKRVRNHAALVEKEQAVWRDVIYGIVDRT